MKRLVPVLVVIAALAVTAPVFGFGKGMQSGSPSKWENIQVGLTYRLYKPGKTLGFKLNKLKTIACGQGQDDWVAATYGTYKGVLGTKAKGFAVYEGHPICADAATSTRINGDPPLVIMGSKVRVGVYCDTTNGCNINQGYSHGFTLTWTAKPSSPYKKNTRMQLDSAHLTFAQVVKIAKGLEKVG